MAGGEALQVSTTAAQRAAEEARSGKWLEELESGKPLRAHIPGIVRGAFGAWALAEAEGGYHFLHEDCGSYQSNITLRFDCEVLSQVLAIVLMSRSLTERPGRSFRAGVHHSSVVCLSMLCLHLLMGISVLCAPKRPGFDSHLRQI